MTIKLSQITAAGSAPALSDQLIGVTAGTTDNLFSLTQISNAVLGGVSGATVTTSAPVLNLAQTWNASGTTFTGLKFNATSTASAAGSLLADFQLGGSSVLSLRKDGLIIGGFIVNGNPTTALATNGGTAAVGGTATSANIAFGADAAGLSGAIMLNPTTGVIEWSSAAGNAFSGAYDLILSRQAAGIFALSNGVNATAFRCYNTSDVAIGAPTNYERFAIDWNLTANKMVLSPQSGGTGTLRSVDYYTGPGGHFYFGTWGVSVSGNIAYTSGIMFGCSTNLFYLSDTGNSNNGIIQGPANSVIGWNADAHDGTNGLADTALSRIAVGVVGFGNGVNANRSAYIQWGGQARVTSDFSVTSSVTLVNVTGLTVNVAAGRTYNFQAELYVTDAAAGGVQAAIAGTATATAIQYTGYTIADNAIKAKTNATALATAVGSTVTTETSGIIVRITGIITVNVAGTLTVQMAQNTSNGTATIAKRGSYLIVHDMP